VATIYAVIMQV